MTYNYCSSYLHECIKCFQRSQTELFVVFIFIVVRALSGKPGILLARQGPLYNSSLDSSIGDIAGLAISILWLHVVRIHRAAAGRVCVYYWRTQYCRCTIAFASRGNQTRRALQRINFISAATAAAALNGVGRVRKIRPECKIFMLHVSLQINYGWSIKQNWAQFICYFVLFGEIDMFVLFAMPVFCL